MDDRAIPSFKGDEIEVSDESDPENAAQPTGIGNANA
jgi:hypothetical protein